MELILIILIFSLLFNLILFRLSFGEYGKRRQWQREAIALSDALRSVHRDLPPRHRPGILPWLLIAAVFVLMTLLALSAGLG